MAAISQLSKFLFVDRAAENARIADMVQKLGIKVGNIDDPVATLSGGNQQKVVIGKWLMTDARIVLLNDPTRGIDVGTKQELYQLLRSLADAGTTILFYTTDYDELVGCCDRVAIMYDGRILRELAGRKSTSTTSSPARSICRSNEIFSQGAPQREISQTLGRGQQRILPGVGLCLLMFAVYFGVPPVGTLITALMDGLNAAFPSDIDNLCL